MVIQLKMVEGHEKWGFSKEKIKRNGQSEPLIQKIAKLYTTHTKFSKF